ncbi:MAG: hypothetical protein ACLS37_10875 [Alistipes sp.]
MLEGYIKGVRLQKVYTGSAGSTTRTAPTRPRRCSPNMPGGSSSFTLRTTAFVDVAKTFRERFEHNRRREAESREAPPQVCCSISRTSMP